MIVYSLHCDKEHGFDAWFKSSDDFDLQAQKSLISCPVCGSTKVTKSLMAPSVATSRRKRQGPPEGQNPMHPSGPAPAAVPNQPSAPVALSKTDPKMAVLLDAMRKLKNHITENADYVGPKFAEEARKIHYGETAERGIYGETTLKEAETLRDEGIAVQPLPILPDETN